MKIAFVGCGVMGEAILKSLLAKGLVSPQEVTASDVSHSRCQLLSQRYGITCGRDNRRAVDGAEVVILAIKPQNLDEVMAELQGHLKPHQLVISIAARGNLADLTQGLSHNAVVRAMPNTPAQIGQGMTVWTSPSGLSQPHQEAAKAILSSLGKELYVSDEKYIDMSTAVSGSGPAYVFLFIEAFIDAAVHIGFSREVASELVLQTVLGSAQLAAESGKHPAELRNMVTSPGGVTAEGLLCLEKGGLRALLTQAVIKGYQKSGKLHHR
jgi:pyrroline-5-carboxylate reductase